MLAGVRSWMIRTDTEPFALGPVSLTRIQACLFAMRSVAQSWRSKGGEDGADISDAATHSPGGGRRFVDDLSAVSGARRAVDETKALKAQIQQRDNEIAILVDMVKSARAGATSVSAAFADPVGGAAGVSGGRARTPAAMPAGIMQHPAPLDDYSAPPTLYPGQRLSSTAAASSAGTAGAAVRSDRGLSDGVAQNPPEQRSGLLRSADTSIDIPGGLSAVGIMLANGTRVPESVLRDRDQAFEAFRASYPKASIIEDNKRVLKEKFDLAKATAEKVNAARDATTRLKGEIERRRVEIAMATVVKAESKSSDAAEIASTEVPRAGECEYMGFWRVPACTRLIMC
jgi:hypothetical protein